MTTAFLRLAGFSLLAVAALAACGRADAYQHESAVESDSRGPRPALAIRVLGEVAVAAALQDGETQRVFRTAGEFRHFFGVAAPTHVDFSREWVAFYSAGVRADSGAEAVIESVRPSLGGTMLLVTTRLRTPGSDCVTDVSATRRFALVAFAAPEPAPRTTRFYTAATPTACPRTGAPDRAREARPQPSRSQRARMQVARTRALAGSAT